MQSPAPRAYCTFCGGGQHSGGCPLFEQRTMAFSSSSNLPSEIEEVSQNAKQALGFQFGMERGHAIAVPGRDCSVIRVLGDGNCLFNALAVGRLFLLVNAEVTKT